MVSPYRKKPDRDCPIPVWEEAWKTNLIFYDSVDFSTSRWDAKKYASEQHIFFGDTVDEVYAKVEEWRRRHPSVEVLAQAHFCNPREKDKYPNHIVMIAYDRSIYRVVSMSTTGDDGHRYLLSDEDLAQMLENYLFDGWELVGFCEHNRAVFRRTRW